MKFLHISDLHLGLSLNGLSLLEDQRYALKKVINHLKTHKVDYLFIAGDIYDKVNPSSEAISLFEEFLEDLVALGTSVLIVSGNHDSSVRLSYLSKFLKFNKIYISKPFSGDLETFEFEDEFGLFKIHLLPFFKVSRAKSLLKEDLKTYNEALKLIIGRANIDYSQRNILISHLYINGASLSGSEEVMVGNLEGASYEIFKDFDYVALGHIHKPQILHYDYIRYCGTLLKYSLSEEKDTKSIPLVILKDKKNLKIDLVDADFLRDVKVIKGSFKDLIKHSYTRDYVKVVLTDEVVSPDARMDLLNIFENMVAFSIENSKTRLDYSLEDFEEIDDIYSLFEKFYRLQNNDVKPSEDHIKIIDEVLKEVE